jgi:hypothetical protein
VFLDIEIEVTLSKLQRKALTGNPEKFLKTRLRRVFKNFSKPQQAVMLMIAQSKLLK